MLRGLCEFPKSCFAKGDVKSMIAMRSISANISLKIGDKTCAFNTVSKVIVMGTFNSVSVLNGLGDFIFVRFMTAMYSVRTVGVLGAFKYVNSLNGID